MLAGLPNAGKSSLLNALLGESRAIVTPTAGTTRDSIDAVIDLNGLRVSLWDTAGLELEGRREIDEIERLGIERSERHIAEADLVVFLFSPDLDLSSQLQRFSNLPLSGKNTLVALSKSDTKESRERKWLSDQITEATSYPTLEISAETGSGIEQLQNQILATLVSDSSNLPDQLICNERHFNALGKAADSLSLALDRLADPNFAAELMAFEIRQALGALDEIVGVTSNEDILGRVFSKFCVGK